MKDIILIIATIWTISAVIMRKQVFEKDIPQKITNLRLILAPLLLIFSIIDWTIFSIISALRKN